MLTLADAEKLTAGRIFGDDSVAFQKISPIYDAGPEDMAFLADRRYAEHLSVCPSRALLVSEALGSLEGGPTNRLVVPDPHAALVVLLPVLHPEPKQRWGIHPTAVIHASATVDKRVAIGPNVVIGADVSVGQSVDIGANCVVGAGVSIGTGTTLFPNVTIYARSALGERVIVHAGTRIGVDGFGYVRSTGAIVKVPQMGDCVIENDVEIGANCTIDRGSIGRTVVGTGSKLDNLVHIAHNVVIGPRSILVAQVGVAGSTRTGEGVAMGGQAGLVGHLKIGAGARIGAQAGVIGDVAPGQVVSGYPARDHRTYLKAMARIMRMPDLLKRVDRIERRLQPGGATSPEDPG